MIRRLTQRGDTLVEVLFATVVLSIVLAGAYTLSNRATELNQESFERTKVSNLLQEQAELIRAARDSFDPASPSAPQSQTWSSVIANRKSVVSDVGTVCSDLSQLELALSGRSAFYVDASSGSVLVNSGRVLVDELFNVWVELVDGVDYYDVHAFSCWESLNAEQALRTSIIVRLEDPVQ